jgi:putative ABC transport system permease protein
MRWLRRLKSRLDALLHGEVRERGMDEELRFHVEMETQANVKRGLPPEAARRAALVSFGGVERVKDECRDSWGVRLVETSLQDLRYGLRSLRANPGFTLVVILTLGLGIGANTAIFSVVNAVLLRPLPYASGEQLVALQQEAPAAGIEYLGLSPLEVIDYRAASDTLDGVVEYHSMNFTLLGGVEPQRVTTGVVSWNFFDVLGVKPVLGRDFRTTDEGHQADAVLLLSHDFWRNQLGGDPGVIGRQFEMNDRVHTVVGVLPPLPPYPDANDVFMPASACPFRSRASVAENREARMLRAFGRVKAGVPLAQAKAEVGMIGERLRAQYPAAYPKVGYRADLRPVREELIQGARPPFLALLATAALVLLIACANVANLIIARLSGRERELAVRAALGAGRSRIVRQLLTESTILALAGGALGLVLAAAGARLLSTFAARFTPRATEVSLDGSVLAFTLLVSLATGIVAGSLPGLPAWPRLARALGESGRTTSGPGRRRLRGALVVVQLAFSFILLIGAALTLRSLSELSRVDAGFRAENVLTMGIDLNWSSYTDKERETDREQILTFHESLAEKTKAMPGVIGVGASWTFPLNDRFSNDNSFEIEGRAVDAGQPLPQADYRSASPDYFDTIGVPLLRGRVFDPHDRVKAPAVAVLSRGLARRYWGDVDPIGQRISDDKGKTWRTVVGVVGDVRNASLDKTPKDTLYLPFLQFPGFSYTYFVRTVGDPMVLAHEVRQTVYALDPQTAVANVRTLEQVRHESIASPRLIASLLGAFATLALAITAAGLSGLIAFTVSQRTHEIGIRMALGADSPRVVRMLLRQGLSSVAIGLVLGVAGALALTRLVAGMLYGVAPTDVVCFVASGAVLVMVATLACWGPARRATSIDPQVALRSL